MIEISFQTDHPAWKKILRKSRMDFTLALQKTFDALILPNKKFEVAISFIGDDEMRGLNAHYRDKDKSTNVLSFPLIEDFSDLKKWPEPLALGDIVMAYEPVFREADEQGKSLHDHVMHLLVHGLLHLFGYDHMNKKDAKEMEGLEIAILAELGIQDPY